MRELITTQGSLEAFSAMIAAASAFRRLGPTPAVSAVADSLSMMLSRFVTCWKVPETEMAQEVLPVPGPSLTPAQPQLHLWGDWAGTFLSPVQVEKLRPQLRHALMGTRGVRNARTWATLSPPSSGCRGSGSSVSSDRCSLESIADSAISSPGSFDIKEICQKYVVC